VRCPYFAHHLCVPLDADEPLLREFLVLDCLYHPIARAGGYCKTVAELFDPLVMVGVNLGVLASGDLKPTAPGLSRRRPAPES
jgi:hypothetical protein